MNRSFWIGLSIAMAAALLALWFAALAAPVGAQIDCTPVTASILVSTPALQETSGYGGAPVEPGLQGLVKGERHIEWNAYRGAIVITADVVLDTGVITPNRELMLGGPMFVTPYGLHPHWTWAAQEGMSYTLYVHTLHAYQNTGLVFNSTIAEAAADYHLFSVGSTRAYTGRWEYGGLSDGADGIEPVFFKISVRHLEGDPETVFVQGMWEVALLPEGCAYIPPSPNSVDLYDLYNLPGDYGRVGRLFDFRVIFTVIQGFLDILGVSNLRDFIAIGAALVVMIGVLARQAGGPAQ